MQLRIQLRPVITSAAKDSKRRDKTSTMDLHPQEISSVTITKPPNKLKSQICNYFNKISDKEAVYKICNKNLKTSGNTSNLRGHLENLHSQQWLNAEIPSKKPKKVGATIACMEVDGATSANRDFDNVVPTASTSDSDLKIYSFTSVANTSTSIVLPKKNTEDPEVPDLIPGAFKTYLGSTSTELKNQVELSRLSTVDVTTTDAMLNHAHSPPRVASLPTLSPPESQLFKYTNVMKGWQYRWFVLVPEAGVLSYYLNETERRQRPRGSVHLAAAVISPSDEDSNTFTVNSATGEMFKLRASDARARHEWVSRIRAITEMHTMAIAHVKEAGKEKKEAYKQMIVVKSETKRTDVKSTDHDILLLKATSNATVMCLGQCLSILQHQQIAPLTISQPTVTSHESFALSKDNTTSYNENFCLQVSAHN
uniref:PH domain-containing protein n=1 Tax=Timema genevievae TaxID=629358 RepID=A0A7R9K1T6_TIMGE|nr:unnamed protein product [Timema genevievae]